MAPYQKTAPPHIVSADSVSKIMWKSAGALMPLIGMRILLFGSPAIGCFFVCLVSAFTSAWIAKAFFNRAIVLSEGHAVLTGALMAAALPTGLPLWIVAAGAFFAVFFATEIFGGLGANPFHPVAAGIAFIGITFPWAFTQISEANSSAAAVSGAWLSLPMKGWNEWILIHSSLLTGSAATLGALMLVGQKLIRWEVPLIYLMVLCLCSFFFGEAIFSVQALLYAFFIVTDSVTGCSTRAGQNGFALGAALLAVFYRHWFYPDGLALSVLMMNAVSPWLDFLTQPKGKRLLISRDGKTFDED